MIPVDITMLAWPGWRGLLARKRWRQRYGADDLERFLARAAKRHEAWTARGCQLALVKSTRDPKDPPHTYVEAVCGVHGLLADEQGRCPRC